MAAVIHMVRPTTAKTFSEYVSPRIVPYLEAQITSSTQRIDIVWDNYTEEKSSKLSRSNGVGITHGQESTIAVVQSRSVTGQRIPEK